MYVMRITKLKRHVKIEVNYTRKPKEAVILKSKGNENHTSLRRTISAYARFAFYLYIGSWYHLKLPSHYPIQSNLKSYYCMFF